MKCRGAPTPHRPEKPSRSVPPSAPNASAAAMPLPVAMPPAAINGVRTLSLICCTNHKSSDERCLRRRQKRRPMPTPLKPESNDQVHPGSLQGKRLIQGSRSTRRNNAFLPALLQDIRRWNTKNQTEYRRPGIQQRLHLILKMAEGRNRLFPASPTPIPKNKARTTLSSDLTRHRLYHRVGRRYSIPRD